MQPRLTRSQTDRMLAGVCGGLADYFAIDPAIVRLIFVLVSLTSGIGVLLYPVLWIVMPKGGSGPDQHLFPSDPDEWRRRVAAVGQEAAEIGQSVEREVIGAFGGRQGGRGAPPGPAPTGYAPPPPEPYSYDPFTGQPLAAPVTPPPPPRRRGSRWAGFALIGLGVIFAAQYFGIPTDVIFPVLMIAVGVFMLVRR